ncbi:hypothetical protein AMECASPLE_033561 [Ameca splendens]|uniref:Uncharacterized protein n=1 Tax=Ameca splendens TaxID=208324 RepID=A0ABV0ZTY5_9TELE
MYEFFFTICADGDTSSCSWVSIELLSHLQIKPQLHFLSGAIYLCSSSLTMLLQAHTSGLVVFLLAAFLPGLRLQRDGSSNGPVLNPEAQFYRPVLQQSETIPTPGEHSG